MNKPFSVFLYLFLALISTEVMSQDAQSFEDFGYPEELVTWGSNSSLSYYIPIDANRLLEGSFVSLEFLTSQVLDVNNSFITISIGDIPVATKKPTANSNITNFKIPIKARDVVSGFVKIEVINDFRINQDICESYSQGAFWIRRLDTSSILLNYENSDTKKHTTISEFIASAERILIPEKASIQELQYAAYIQFYFERVMNTKLEIGTLPKVNNSILNSSIIIAQNEQLPKYFNKTKDLKAISTDHGWVGLQVTSDSIETGNSTRSFQSLLVTGSNDKGLIKAGRSLLDQDIYQSAYSRSYVVTRAHQFKNERRNKELHTLRELNVQEELTQGIGKLFKEINISRSSFPNGISGLELNLNFAYRPLKETEDGYVNLYIDDVLKYSGQLNGSGSFNETIGFEELEPKRNNTLKVEYYYVPDGGFCKENPASFYAQINIDRSTLKATGLTNDQLSFFHFPENFEDHESRIYWDLPINEDQVIHLSNLIGQLNSGRNESFVYPQVLELDRLKQNEKKQNAIIISSESNSLDEFAGKHPYLKLKQDKYQFEKEDYNHFFTIDYVDKIGVNQLFKKDDETWMFIYVPEGKPEILHNLIAGIQSTSLTNTGDVILSNSEESYFFNLNKGTGIEQKKEIENDFDQLWKRYRVFIIFGLFILMIVLLIYIYQKSQESKNNIVNDQ